MASSKSIFLKSFFYLSLLTSSILSLSSTSEAYSQLDRVEIPLERVLAPYNGYDDNDQVEVILQGALPNACYTLADTFYRSEDDGSTITVRQYAIKLSDDICDQGSILPAHLAAAVPFTNSIALGTLPSAEYSISFFTNGDRSGTRILNVAPANSSLVDSKPYAVVNTILVPSLVQKGSQTTITLNGVLNSECVDLAEKFEIILERDVLVVLPTLKIDATAQSCAQVTRPYSRNVVIPGFKAGKTLVHVRSMNGKSLNAVVESR